MALSTTISKQSTVRHATAPSHAWYRIAPVATFGVIELVAGVMYVVRSRSQWFFQDEWEFLAARELDDLDGLLRPHNEHWSTAPIVVYRILYRLFGLRTYSPYVGLAVVLHLAIGALLWIVMRRSGVRPWMATLCASVFVLFGSGYQNIAWGFQIAFTGAVLLGLTQLLLADHDGGIRRRDWIGLAAGLVALTCSGVAIAMTISVGVSTLIRRGWRMAAFHTVPLGAVYTWWWLRYARENYKRTIARPSGLATFVETGIRGTFDALGQFPALGIAIEVLLASGLALWFVSSGGSQRRSQGALPLSLLLGAAVFLAFSAVGRAAEFGNDFALRSRYLHVLAALILPAIAVAADAIARRGRAFTFIVVSLLLVGIPGNMDEFDKYIRAQKPINAAQKAMVASLPRSPDARNVPNWRPDRARAQHITVAWLLDQLDADRLPRLGEVTPALQGANEIRLSLQQRPVATPLNNTQLNNCAQLPSGGRDLRVEPGDQIGVTGGHLTIQLVTDEGVISEPVFIVPSRSPSLVAWRSMRLRFSPTSGEPVELCNDAPP